MNEIYKFLGKNFYRNSSENKSKIFRINIRHKDIKKEKNLPKISKESDPDMA